MRTTPLPPLLPILRKRMASGEVASRYPERELTARVLLCDARGRLNPDAVGWSRVPLVTANLRGHWLRKKKWNFWNWISRNFVFSVTVADIDYASFCGVSFTDFATGERIDGMDLRRSGFAPLPEQVDRSIAWRSKRIDYVVDHAGDARVEFHTRDLEGIDVHAEFMIRRPPDHETLNVVVPWTRHRFQLNSKHNTLPCEGHVTVAGKRYPMVPEECHAVQDWGRGVWPYRSHWNWAVATGTRAGQRIGVNMGDKWTTGTGSNENGICIDGRLHKIMEDLAWDYDPSNWMRPWRVHAPHSGAIDLTLVPLTAKTTKLALGVLATGGTCAFGRWHGTLRVEGREIAIQDVIGWAEEYAHRW